MRVEGGFREVRVGYGLRLRMHIFMGLIGTG